MKFTFESWAMLLGFAWLGYLIGFANMASPANWVWAFMAYCMAFQPKTQRINL